MKKPLVLIAAALLLPTLAACNRQGPELTAQSADEAWAGAEEGNVDTVVVSTEIAKVGTALTPEGDIASEQARFAPGDTVYISLPTQGRALGATVDAFWFHEDGVSRKDEKKRIEGPFTTFQFQPEDPGRYNVELDVNRRPVALAEFIVE